MSDRAASRRVSTGHLASATAGVASLEAPADASHPAGDAGLDAIEDGEAFDVAALDGTATGPRRRKGATPEALVTRAVLRVFAASPVVVERRTVGYDAQRGVRYGTPGEPDLRLSWHGRTCGVELKRPGPAARLSTTQRRWIDRHAAHVPTWVVDSAAGARVVLAALTGPTWPVDGRDVRGLL